MMLRILFVHGRMERFSEERACLYVYSCVVVYDCVSITHVQTDKTFEKDYAILNITFDGSHPGCHILIGLDRRLCFSGWGDWIKASFCAEGR